jgi:hypothetical protein
MGEARAVAKTLRVPYLALARACDQSTGEEQREWDERRRRVLGED